MGLRQDACLPGEGTWQVYSWGTSLFSSCKNHQNTVINFSMVWNTSKVSKYYGTALQGVHTPCAENSLIYCVKWYSRKSVLFTMAVNFMGGGKQKTWPGSNNTWPHCVKECSYNVQCVCNALLSCSQAFVSTQEAWMINKSELWYSV